MSITDEQVLGLTGDESPLTPDDVRAAIKYAFGGECGEWLLAGGDRAEWVRSPGGCAGWPTDHYSVDVSRRRNGVLIRVQEHAASRAEHGRPGPPPPPTAVRIGRLTWRQVEDVVRAMAEPSEPEQLDLFEEVTA